MKHLLLRNKTYHFRMRRPKRYERVCPEREIIRSLRTDSPSEASRLVPIVKQQVLADLEARLLGKSPEKEIERYEAALKLAKAHNIRMKTTKQLLDAPLEDLLQRIEKIEQIDPNARTALPVIALSRPDPPSKLLSEIANGMEQFRPHEIALKNQRQKSVWINRYKRAAAAFIEVVGDKAIKLISDDDAYDLRRYWQSRLVGPDPVTTDYANKHLGYMRAMIDAYYASVEIDRYDNPFKGLSIRDRPVRETKRKENRKLEFSPKWIKETLLTHGPLAKLNAEARDITIICAETGCRQSEIFDLPASSIILDAPIPYIKIQVEDTVPGQQREVKTASSIRDVPLLGHALEAMKRHPRGFPRYRGNANYYNVVQKYLKTRGLLPSANHSIGGLRHSFESRMRRAGIDNEERGFLMGHSIKTLRSREFYGDETSLTLKALYTEMVVFPTDNWTPRNRTELLAEINRVLEEEGFRIS